MMNFATCQGLPPSINYLSSNCEDIFDNFGNAQIISSGTKGTIFKVHNKLINTDTAIKIQLFDENALNELIVGCTLNSLPTDCFVKYTIWFVCKSLPEWGISDTLQISETRNYLFIEMNKVEISIETLVFINASLDIFALLSILFEIIYALYLARKAFLFSHNDLHANNILIQQLDDYTSQSYMVNNTKFTLERKYIPIIIDYDNATMNRDLSSTDTKNLYLTFSFLLNNVKGMGPHQRNLYLNILDQHLNKITSPTDTKSLETALLSDIFSGFIDE